MYYGDQKLGENNAVSALRQEGTGCMIYLLVYGIMRLVSIPAHPRHSVDTKSQREARRIMTYMCAKTVRISLGFPSAIPLFSKHYTRSSKVPNAAGLEGNHLIQFRPHPPN